MMRQGKPKIRKTFVWILGIIVAVALWSIERTNKIPQYGMIFYEMGLHCENARGPQREAQYFQKAVYFNPALEDAHYRLGLIYEKAGKYAEALESFTRAIEIYQKTLPYYEAGRLYFREGAYEQALRYFLRISQRTDRPNEEDYYLARIYDQRKQYDAALPHYFNFVGRHPEYAPEIGPRLAQMCHFLNKEEACSVAIGNFRKADKDDLADQLEQSLNSK